MSDPNRTPILKAPNLRAPTVSPLAPAKEEKGEAAPPPSIPLSEPPLEGAVAAKPVITLTPGEDHLAIAEAERILAATGQYFHMGGQLVRLANKSGSARVERINEQTLYVMLSAMIDWHSPHIAR